MPSKTTFKHYDLSFHKQQRLTISNFLGVDYNPAQLQVAVNHATDMENMVYENRVTQKRRGYEQLAKIKKEPYYVETENGYEQKLNEPHFNGFWAFIGGDGAEHCVAHIGKLLYIVTGLGKNKSFLDCRFTPILKEVEVGQNTYKVAIELEDFKSMAFHGYRCLFIVGGNALYILRINGNQYTLKAVEDSDETYIPITTIGITDADSAVNERQALDDVNMMTQYRKNKLVTGTYMDDGVNLRTTRFWDYSLDTSIKPKKSTDINNVRVRINSLKEVL